MILVSQISAVANIDIAANACVHAKSVLAIAVITA